MKASISLPRGGGAIRGIGETFKPRLFDGTGSWSVPIAVSPGRGGSAPSLALEYSAGSGNGLFGFGWALSLPTIVRKTEKGLPRYDDTDTFLLSGAEDLVRVSESRHGEFLIDRYRPRTEGLFARIERWTHETTRDAHWRVASRDNVTSVYGRSPDSRIADPDDASRVFEWLLDETFDAYGNHVAYEYARDADAAPAGIYENNRRATQRYPRRICYGNLAAPVAYPGGGAIGCELDGRRYLFEVVFDYGDWALPTRSPHTGPAASQESFGADVPTRPDVFSSFTARFDVRTLRRCRRVLMFHHFAELGQPTLVRSTSFDYLTDPDTLISFLESVTTSGYVRDANGVYTSASIPPLVFEYAPFAPETQRYRSLVVHGDDLPASGLDDPDMALVDLFGDGLVDLLQGTSTGFRYWRNLGDGRLDRPRSLPQIPAGVSLGAPGVGFGDMGGDARADLLVHAGPVPGFYETTSAGTWKNFRAYEQSPSFDLSDPGVRMLDLTGDGLTDALMTTAEHFLWFQCLGEQGFAAPEFIARGDDPDLFPDIFFNGPAGRVRIASMCGGALADIVQVHGGRIDYWPNLGYGRFGRRITMANAPRLGADVDPKRLFFADLNGTGCADLVYVERDRVHFWFNRSGNAWSERRTIRGTPLVDSATALTFADVFGTGTATLVWSYAYSGQSEGNYKALDFCGGVKPYLLTAVDNNMGTTTRVSYASSSHHALEDRARGTPWITSLPFPVHVIDKVETIDRVRRAKLVSTFRYHHGYYDGREREFRGFGRVDQFDTETFEDFRSAELHGAQVGFDNALAAFHAPPMETRTWFHTGAYMEEDSAAAITDAFDYRDFANHLRREFYHGDALAAALPEHEVVRDATPREAFRTLRGAVLRTEIYARDGSAAEPHPYGCTENRYRVRALRAATAVAPGVYVLELIETLTHQYERDPADPRVSHSQTLEVDEFLNPLRSLVITYGRRAPAAELPTDADRDKQTRAVLVYSQNHYTNALDALSAAWRTPLPAAQSTYELTGFAPQDGGPLFSLEEWLADDFARLRAATEIAFEAAAPSGECKRRTSATRTYYRSDDLATMLPLGTLETLALSFEVYKLAFTPGLLGETLTRAGQPLLAGLSAVLAGRGDDGGGYVDLDADGHWWVPSGRTFLSPRSADSPAEELAYARAHFFQTLRTRDPFHSATVSTENLVAYDRYDLLLRESRDALGNVITAGERLPNGETDLARSGLDYRVLQSTLIMDPNRNRCAALFDALGTVVATAVMGKPEESLGDSLDSTGADLPEAALLDFLADPRAQARTHLADASTRYVYDLFAYRRTAHTANPTPVTMCVVERETHATAPGGDAAGLQLTISYFDGIGGPLQHKTMAEPGPVPLRDADGRMLFDAQGELVLGPDGERWRASEWVQVNNKGKPVRAFQPFFSDTHRFEPGVTAGSSSRTFYDPQQRPVAQLHADHTWEKHRFDSWRSEVWDVNDTASLDPRLDADVAPFFARLPDADYLPTWFGQRAGGALGADEQAAAEQTLLYAHTPSVEHLDALGRTFLSTSHVRVARNGILEEARHQTRVELDVLGRQRAMMDALDRVVARCDFDLLGRALRETGMDTGTRWNLHDASGKVIRSWDERGQVFRMRYDAERRLLETLLTESGNQEKSVFRMRYGESLPDAEARNCRGMLVHTFDQAGLVRVDEYDFKSNPLRISRELAHEYRDIVDWQQPQALDAPYVTRTEYDALNRATAVVTPDNSLYLPSYNRTGLVGSVHVRLRGAAMETPFVLDIAYDAHGRRTSTVFGNGVRTECRFDAKSHRLATIRTMRGGGALLQGLRYTYDALGNVTHRRDEAQQTLYFAGAVVTPDCDYEYDSAYRLVATRGREHIGQNAPTDWNDEFRMLLPGPGDAQAMRRYEERYDYDPAGNLLHMIHRAAQNGNWTREYSYAEPSAIDPAHFGNRLSGTSVGSAARTYTHDAHGNMASMPHLTRMSWDFKDQLRATSRQAASSPETTWYVYDAAGQRVRKVTDRGDGRRKCERIYLGTLEVYREYGTNLDDVRLERESLEVGDGDGPIARVETRTRGSDGVQAARVIRYQFESGPGSGALELDENAAIISYEEYYPYGSTSYQAGRNVAEVKLKRYRFAGMERDEESGFASHGVRCYAPWLGRWTSADPVGIAGDSNLYRYSAGDPVNLVDTDGQGIGGAFRRFLANQKNGRAYERAWERYFNARHDVALVIRQSTWKALSKRGKLVTQYFLGGARRPDLGIVMKSGLTIAFETGSPPSFEGGYMSTKQIQLRQDAEAIKRGYVLGGGDNKLIQPTESRIGRGLPVLGPEGNGLESNRVRYEAHLKAQGKEVPKPPPISDLEGNVKAGKGAGTGGKVVNVGAVILFFMLSSGSTKERIQSLAIGVGMNVAQDALAARVVGAAGARALSLPLALVIGMCSDQAGSCEAQERAKQRAEAEEAMRERLIKRSMEIYMQELAKGYEPELPFVFQMAVNEEYEKSGLKAQDERERQRNDPNSCSIYSPTTIDLSPRIPYTGPRQTSMSAR